MELPLGEVSQLLVLPLFFLGETAKGAGGVVAALVSFPGSSGVLGSASLLFFVFE